MDLDFRFVAIATLASLFLVVPSSPGDAVSRAPEVHVRSVPSRPIARLSFPEPPLRTIGVADAEIQPWGSQGDLGPIAIIDEPETPVTHVTRHPVLKASNEDAEGKPNARLASALATIDGLQPSATVAQHPEPLEEFPGVVAVAVPRIAANAKWRRIVEEGPAALRIAECAGDSPAQCAASPWGRWHNLVQKVAALEGEERLQAVNEGINALLTYASDEEVYGVGDHWATLQESMARGRGDCEDIAIAKMWLLNAAGVDLSSMRLVVLKDTLRNLDHAVLSVVEDGHQFVLDNTAWKVGRADWMRGYRPIYALSSQQSWIYGARVPSAPALQIAQSAAPALPQ